MALHPPLPKCVLNISWRYTKGKGSRHTPSTLAGQRLPECLSSPKPVPCVCVVKCGTPERNGEGGGGHVALRMFLFLLFFWGSVLGEGGNWEKLDLVTLSVN